MNTRAFKIIRLASAVVLTAAVLTGTGCTTMYDAYGRPVQAVDPGVALAGVAAAGLVGYALAENHGDHYGYPHPNYYRPYYGPRY